MREHKSILFFAGNTSCRGHPRMDTLDTLLAYSEGDSRLDTLESLYHYSQEEMSSLSRIQPKPAPTLSTTSTSSNSTSDTKKTTKKTTKRDEPPRQQQADDSRDEITQDCVGRKELEQGGVLTRITDNLACCTRNIRVSDYMDEAFLEDDFYELVYRPSRRPGALHNALTTSPSYDEGRLKPALSDITETDEKTVHTLDTTKTKELSKRNLSSLYMGYASWSCAFYNDL